MPPTPYPHVNQLLVDLRAGIEGELGDKLAGLYLYGSLVSGDYLDGVSDVDLLAALADDLGEAELERLRAMHAAIVRDRPEWDDRVEVAYLSLEGLRTYQTKRSPLGIISPGEPLHLITAGDDWLMNWYLIREMGVTLLGPDPHTIIAPASKAAFIASVVAMVTDSSAWIAKMRSRNEQSYAILTHCRALRLVRTGEHVSKVAAAEWAKAIYPDDAALIDAALRWRTELPEAEDVQTLPETIRLVTRLQAEIAATGS